MTNKERIAEWTAAHVARSSRFVACLFLGQEGIQSPVGSIYDKREANSLPEAREKARDMLSEYGDSLRGRAVMLYAVTPGDNLSIHIENIDP